MIRNIKILIILIIPVFILLPTSVLAQSGHDCTKTSVGYRALVNVANGSSYYYPNSTDANKQRVGLYADLSNEIPAAHLTKAREAANQIVPRDSAGNPSATGKIGLASIGMSNTEYEFRTFMEIASSRGMSNKVVLVNGASEGQGTSEWSGVNDAFHPWSYLESQVSSAGLTKAQVQAVWLKITRIGPSSSFPGYIQDMERDLTIIIKKLMDNGYTNVKLVFLGSRIYAGYTTNPYLSPEPAAYEGGFAIRYLIQDQQGLYSSTKSNWVDITYDYSSNQEYPVLVWGPYIWADGETTNSEGLDYVCSDLTNDGVHPAGGVDQGAKGKVSNKLLDFLKTNELAKGWFTGVPGSPFPSPTYTPSVTPSASPFAKGDVNHDGQVNQADMTMILNNFGSSSSLLPNYFDPVGDGKINILDTGFVIRDWN